MRPDLRLWLGLLALTCMGVRSAAGRHIGELRGLPPERRLDMIPSGELGRTIYARAEDTTSAAYTPNSAFATASASASPPASTSTSVSRSVSTPASASAASRSALPDLPLPPSAPPTSVPSPIPTPLDLTLSYALTPSCLTYLTSILPSRLFQSCLPLSLLLTTSTSYSDLLSLAIDSANYTTLNSLISYTANPQPSSRQCDDYFAGILKGMGERGNCATDLASRTPIAMSIKHGVGNYEVVREASGLRDEGTGRFCYVQAVGDERPDDLYLWSIPAGIPLPRTSIPTCSPCSAFLLASYMTSESSTLNMTLVQSAVQAVNAKCGGGFVACNAAAVRSSNAVGLRVPPMIVPGLGLGGLLIGLVGVLVAI